MAKSTYGTGSFVVMNTGARPATSTSGLLTSPAWSLPPDDPFALEGAVLVSGAAVQWLRDGLGIIGSAQGIEPLAKTVPDSGGVVFVPALTGLGAPEWDSDARGTILGITRGTTAAHLARATLEAIASQVAALTGLMSAESDLELSQLRVDGGAARNDLLMQMQADLLGVPVCRSAITETTALGATWLAGLGQGIWSDTVELAAHWRSDRQFDPQMSADERLSRLDRWRRAVERSRGWIQAGADPVS
jgi:glycerol kinase